MSSVYIARTKEVAARMLGEDTNKTTGAYTALVVLTY